jgi:hypothetical protein
MKDALFTLSMKEIARMLNEQRISIAETTVNKYADVYREFLPARRLEGERWDKYPPLAVEIVKRIYTLAQPKQGKGKMRHEIKAILQEEFGEQLRRFPIEGDFEDISRDRQPHTHAHTPPPSTPDLAHGSRPPITHELLQVIERANINEAAARSAAASLEFYRSLLASKEHQIQQLEKEKAHVKRKYAEEAQRILDDVVRWQARTAVKSD